MNGLQPTQITIFHVLWLCAVVGGGALGVWLGSKHFGTIGAITGGIIGVVIGHVVGELPWRLSAKRFLRKIQLSSNEELRAMLESGFWNFCHTMVLLQLAARGQEVRGELPRIIGMLESDDELTRVYGWDALRLVFDKEAKSIEDYDPRSSAEDCRSKVRMLKATMEQGPP